MENLKEKPWHQFQIEEVLRLLDVDVITGLSGAEIKLRREKFGPNRVTARRGTPAGRKFLQQFNQPLVYILVLAVGVTLFLGEWMDSCHLCGSATNGWTIAGSLAMMGAQLLFTYAPVMNRLFHTAPIEGESWLRIVGVAAMAFVAVEFESGFASAATAERSPLRNKMASHVDGVHHGMSALIDLGRS